MKNELIHFRFLYYELLPSDRRLVHNGGLFHRCGYDQRLLEIPSSCCRIADNNPTDIIYKITFFCD